MGAMPQPRTAIAVIAGFLFCGHPRGNDRYYCCYCWTAPYTNIEFIFDELVDFSLCGRFCPDADYHYTTIFCYHYTTIFCFLTQWKVWVSLTSTPKSDRRHCWISSFWTPAGKRPLLLLLLLLDPSVHILFFHCDGFWLTKSYVSLCGQFYMEADYHYATILLFVPHNVKCEPGSPP